MKFPEKHRVPVIDGHPDLASTHGDPYGVFQIGALNIIASNGHLNKSGTVNAGWEHVSVSIAGKRHATPSWEEMDLVKRMFWDDSETVVQFHPARVNHINRHPGCLHLWRYTAGPFPTPPLECV